MPAETIGPQISGSNIDFAPLTSRMSRSDLSNFTRWARALPTPYPNTVVGTVRSVIVVLVALGAGSIVLALALMLFIALAPAAVAAPPAARWVLLFLVGGMTLAGAVVATRLLFDIVRRDVNFSNRWRAWYRLAFFAQANGWGFVPERTNPPLAGAIFNVGDSRLAYDCLSARSGRYFEIGNHQYSGNGVGQRALRHWGYFAIRLDRRLPHMVLEAKANRHRFAGSNLPASFRSKQLLALEGDFNISFTLFAPRGYERDALYLFTPDLMALLVDEASSYDVEVIDDWMYVYSPKPFDLLARSTYGRVLRIVDTVGAKTLSRSVRYRDERTENFDANTVAPGGRRLRRSLPIGATIGLGVILVLVMLSGLASRAWW